MRRRIPPGRTTHYEAVLLDPAAASFFERGPFAGREKAADSESNPPSKKKKGLL
jgi:hypothetical protein